MTRLLPITVAAAALALISGCTASSTPTASGDAGSGAPAASPSVSSAGASGPKDACGLVTEAMLQTAYGFDPGAGTSKPGNDGTGSTECDYGTKVSVQVSGQADLYMPKTIYSAEAVGNGAVTPPGADYGYAAKDVVVVVKGTTGVLVAITVAGTTSDQGATLAAAIVGEL